MRNWKLSAYESCDHLNNVPTLAAILIFFAAFQLVTSALKRIHFASLTFLSFPQLAFLKTLERISISYAAGVRMDSGIFDVGSNITSSGLNGHPNRSSSFGFHPATLIRKC